MNDYDGRWNIVDKTDNGDTWLRLINDHNKIIYIQMYPSIPIISNIKNALNVNNG